MLKEKGKKEDFEEVKGDVIDSDDELDNTDRTTNEEESKRGIDDYIQMEFDALADDEEIEKLINMPESFEKLNQDHYPLFVTIKRLIYMLDASMDHSFFSRNAEGKIIGMDSNVEWHNESRGVLMIN